MSTISVEFFSESLIRPTHFGVFLPNDRTQEDKPMKTLFLLHGYTGAGGNWVPEQLARKYNVAVVTPTGENAFWLDGLSTGHKFCTLIGKELVEYVRKTFGLAMKPEDTCIMGLSMGGFGALHTAFAYPETFGKTAGMSSALIVHGIAHMKPGEDNGVGNYEYYRECFGDLETVEERDCNPEVLVKKLHDEGKKIPEIFISCGTEDFLIEPNRAFHAFLEKEGITHTYVESKGSHDMDFWNEYTEKFMEMMFGEK